MTLRNIVHLPRVSSSAVQKRQHDPYFLLQSEINRLFNDDLFPSLAKGAQTSLPTIDVIENEKEYKVKAELPGMKEDDVDISVKDQYLTISGEKTVEEEHKEDNFISRECSYGSFRRSFLLPDSADADNASAAFSKGVLTITIPKRKEAKETEKKIKVTVKE